jgi:hypothetical protein
MWQRGQLGMRDLAQEIGRHQIDHLDRHVLMGYGSVYQFGQHGLGSVSACRYIPIFLNICFCQFKADFFDIIKV